MGESMVKWPTPIPFPKAHKQGVDIGGWYGMQPCITQNLYFNYIFEFILNFIFEL